jgi:hypothetical protein
MDYTRLTADEETEILRLAKVGWLPKVISRRMICAACAACAYRHSCKHKVHRSLGAVIKIIGRGRVRTDKERNRGGVSPSPTEEEILARVKEIREALGNMPPEKEYAEILNRYRQC